MIPGHSTLRKDPERPFQYDRAVKRVNYQGRECLYLKSWLFEDDPWVTPGHTLSRWGTLNALRSNRRSEPPPGANERARALMLIVSAAMEANALSSRGPAPIRSVEVPEGRGLQERAALLLA